MRCAVLLAVAAVSVTPAHADDKCKGEVEAAFVKQRSATAFRTVATTETPNGPLVRTIDYVAPDRLYSKIVSPTEDAPVETIGIGKWAWANTEGGWEEQPPHMAQMVTKEREAYQQPPKAAADFKCLGKITYEGRDVLGYGTEPATDTDGTEVSTTIFVDPATGLPAAYVTKPTSGEGKPRFSAVYSYGKEIAVMPPIEIPEEASAPTPVPQ
ncbi:MAG: hypothetical protein NW216_15055 [Hyphomicrobium sp.]|nr:hypothetical protein [Hyphomicrobium sp.]